MRALVRSLVPVSVGAAIALVPILAWACRPVPVEVDPPDPTEPVEPTVQAHEPYYWTHPHPPIHVPTYVFSFDAVMQSAQPGVQSCMGLSSVWIHRVDVHVVLTGWGTEVLVSSTPSSTAVESCARQAMQSAGLAQAALYDGARRTFVNPWTPPPPPPPPPVPVVTTTPVERIVASHDERFDACRLGEPDGTRWTLTFDVGPDGRASGARAWPEDDVGACLTDVVERIDFSSAHTTGRASVTVMP